jgi:hypothetical protein
MVIHSKNDKTPVPLWNYVVFHGVVRSEEFEVSAMYTSQSETYTTDVNELPKDLKRVLKVQFREFIHFVEDAQDKIYFYSPNGNVDRAGHNREAA